MIFLLYVYFISSTKWFLISYPKKEKEKEKCFCWVLWISSVFKTEMEEKIFFRKTPWIRCQLVKLQFWILFGSADTFMVFESWVVKTWSWKFLAGRNLWQEEFEEFRGLLELSQGISLSARADKGIWIVNTRSFLGNTMVKARCIFPKVNEAWLKAVWKSESLRKVSILAWLVLVHLEGLNTTLQKKHLCSKS